jgi:iron complex outermembrane receptor protein/outer membrane receptor for ferrienterochelin and colicins
MNLKYGSILLLFFYSGLFAQNKKTIQLLDVTNGKAISNASIQLGIQIENADTNGLFVIERDFNNVVISAPTYEDLVLKLSVKFATKIDTFYLKPLKEMEEVVVVSSTRSNQNIETAPIKVEVLDYEEMEEESTVKPATVIGIIGDISGVQIQQTSAVSANSNVRIQGLDGRYTQVLRDGLPLYEGFSGGFGLMSIPPLDLKQVELIKGSASTLYGAGAIGGLVNLISKRPSTKQEGVVTLNRTTLQETNLNSFFSRRYKKIGYTIYAGASKQNAVDVNKDGFSDVPKWNSFVIHPRLFLYPSDNTTFTIGYTYTNDNRNGGDMLVLDNKKDSVHRFFEENKILRNSGELLLEKNVSGKNKFVFKSSVSSFDRAINKADHKVTANQLDYFSELSFLLNKQKHTWVSGVNFSGNRFKKLSGDSISINDFSNNTIGAFTQYSYKWKAKSSVELGLRNDYQFQYGNFLLPRVAVFHQINNHWGTRAGVGLGYKIPDALTPQINDYPIEKLRGIEDGLKAEKSIGYNAEVNYKTTFGDDNSIFINHAFFLTQLNHSLIGILQTDGMVAFSNAPKPIITKGFDTYIKLRLFEWELYAGYTYTIAERKYLTQNQFMPLTPKFRMAYMLTKEWEGKGRFCIESSYNGFQYREDGTKTPDYFFLAAMAEYKLGKHLTFVLNVENLLDYRQSKTESLYTGSITHPDFKALWAPIDGRAFNLCLKISL